MKGVFNIPDAENEVLQMLWKQPGAIRQTQLLALFEAEGKEWKRQTLNTFLARLEEKGLVKRENRMVSVVYTRDEFNTMQMKEAINQMYDGKLSNFVAAFARENTISDEEAERLIDLLEKK